MKHSFFFILLILLVSLRVAGQDRIDWDQIKAAPGANYLPKSNVSGDGVWTAIGAILSGANAVYGTGSTGYIAEWLNDSTLTFDATGAYQLSVGTDAQRPTGAAGLTRYNTTNGNLEYYGSAAWEYPVKSASSSGLTTSTYVLYGDANGRATGSSALTFAATTTPPLLTVASDIDITYNSISVQEAFKARWNGYGTVVSGGLQFLNRATNSDTKLWVKSNGTGTTAGFDLQGSSTSNRGYVYYTEGTGILFGTTTSASSSNGAPTIIQGRYGTIANPGGIFTYNAFEVQPSNTYVRNGLYIDPIDSTGLTSANLTMPLFARQRTGQPVMFEFQDSTNAQIYRLKGTGQFRWNRYGSGTFAGTPVYLLGVNSSKDVVEYAFSSLYTGWTLAGTSGTPQSIGSGQTVTIAAGTGMTTTAGATRTVTVAADTASVLTSKAWANARSWTLAGDSGTEQAIQWGNTARILGGYGVNTLASSTDTLIVEIDTLKVATPHDLTLVQNLEEGWGINFTGDSVEVDTNLVSHKFDNGSAVLYVSTGGDNSTGEIGNPARPFRDPWTAVDTAIAGQVVHIMPGYYSASTLSAAGKNNLWKDGVRIHCEPEVYIYGSPVGLPSNVPSTTIFWDTTSSSNTLYVSGKGNFSLATFMLYSSNASSSVTIECFQGSRVIPMNGGNYIIHSDYSFSQSLYSYDLPWTGYVDTMRDSRVTFYFKRYTGTSLADLDNTDGENVKATWIIDYATASNFSDRGPFFDIGSSATTGGWTALSVFIKKGYFSNATAYDATSALFGQNNRLTGDFNFRYHCEDCTLENASMFGLWRLGNTEMHITGNYRVIGNIPFRSTQPAGSGLLTFNGTVVADSTVVLGTSGTHTLIFEGRLKTLSANSPIFSLSGSGDTYYLKNLVLENNASVTPIQSSVADTIYVSGAFNQNNSLTDADITYSRLYEYRDRYFDFPTGASADLPTGIAGRSMYDTDSSAVRVHTGLAWETLADRDWVRANFSGTNLYNSNGSFTGNRTITMGGYTANWVSTAAATDVFSIDNNTSGTAIKGASVSGAGVNGVSSSGNGVYAISATGVPLYVWATASATAAHLRADNAGTTDITTFFRTDRATSGTAAAGFGQAWDQYLENDAGSVVQAGRYAVVYTDASSGSRDSKLEISLIDAGTLTERMEILGDGQVTFSGNKVILGPGGIIWTSGSGSPEGVVTAPPGSFYSDTAGGAGVTWWVKESGTGNTGWISK